MLYLILVVVPSLVTGQIPLYSDQYVVASKFDPFVTIAEVDCWGENVTKKIVAVSTSTKPASDTIVVSSLEDIRTGNFFPTTADAYIIDAPLAQDSAVALLRLANMECPPPTANLSISTVGISRVAKVQGCVSITSADPLVVMVYDRIVPRLGYNNTRYSVNGINYASSFFTSDPPVTLCTISRDVWIQSFTLCGISKTILLYAEANLESLSSSAVKGVSLLQPGSLNDGVYAKLTNSPLVCSDGPGVVVERVMGASLPTRYVCEPAETINGVRCIVRERRFAALLLAAGVGMLAGSLFNFNGYVNKEEVQSMIKPVADKLNSLISGFNKLSEDFTKFAGDVNARFAAVEENVAKSINSVIEFVTEETASIRANVRSLTEYLARESNERKNADRLMAESVLLLEKAMAMQNKVLDGAKLLAETSTTEVYHVANKDFEARIFGMCVISADYYTCTACYPRGSTCKCQSFSFSKHDGLEFGPQCGNDQGWVNYRPLAGGDSVVNKMVGYQKTPNITVPAQQRIDELQFEVGQANFWQKFNFYGLIAVVCAAAVACAAFYCHRRRRRLAKSRPELPLADRSRQVKTV